jgi:hypothetical protein
VARGRRRDRFGRIGIDFDDLPESDARHLVFRLAAVARIEADLAGQDADEELARGAELLLSRRTPDQALDGQTAKLAEAMRAAGRDEPAEFDRLCLDGEAGLASALLALRAGIDPDTGWCLMAEEGADELTLLARLAGLDRASTARMLTTIGPALGIPDAVSAIAGYDALPAAEVEERRRWFRLPRPYRDALRWAGNGG